MGVLGALREESRLRWDANLRAGQWIAVACALFSVPCGDVRTILASFSMAAVAFTWFTMARRTHGRARAVATAVTPGFALLLGPAATVLLARVNADMAYTQWFTPLISIFVMALSVQRLEPWRPAVYGAVAGALYILGYDASTWDMAATHRVGFALRPTTQIVRTLLFLGAGGAFSMLTHSLRRSLVRADERSRDREFSSRYRLGRPIASGGMASVVHATYCAAGGFARPVALKRLHPNLAKDPRVVDTFRAEAELGARLMHANIVPVLDFGRVHDSYYLAMEYVAGTDLRALLTRLRREETKLPPRLAALIAFEVLQGLSFAHTGARDAQGRLLRVVHRDLSPGNVLISTTGQVKISDFGIACALREAEQHRARHVAGSMAYLAPEQVRKDGFDARADLFAVGVLLWEMLTCERLFKRDSTAATLRAVVDGEVPPVAGVSSAWDALLARALAQRPERRFESAAAMADAIAELLRAEGEALPRPEELAAFLASPASLVRSSSRDRPPSRSRTPSRPSERLRRKVAEAAPAPALEPTQEATPPTGSRPRRRWRVVRNEEPPLRAAPEPHRLPPTHRDDDDGYGIGSLSTEIEVHLPTPLPAHATAGRGRRRRARR